MSDGSARPQIFVVDDDASVLRGVLLLLRSSGYCAEGYRSAEEFLKIDIPARPACLLVDLRMPEMDGLELQRAVNARHPAMSIIFVSGAGDIRSIVDAVKAGAVDFLTKPVRKVALLAVIETALERSRALVRVAEEIHGFRELFDALTPREQEVAKLVACGKLNKQIAGDLGTATTTVKVHRGRVMRKLGVNSVAALVRFLDKIGIDADSVTGESPEPR